MTYLLALEKPMSVRGAVLFDSVVDEAPLGSLRNLRHKENRQEDRQEDRPVLTSRVI